MINKHNALGEMMDKDFGSLYIKAMELAEKKELTEYASYGKVACALLTDNNNIYTGISLVTDSGGFCAENAAILEMLKSNESKIIKIVTIANGEVRPPCGKCREIIRMINIDNLNTKVLIDRNNVMTINELLPNAWTH